MITIGRAATVSWQAGAPVDDASIIPGPDNYNSERLCT